MLATNRDIDWSRAVRHLPRHGRLQQGQLLVHDAPSAQIKGGDWLDAQPTPWNLKGAFLSSQSRYLLDIRTSKELDCTLQRIYFVGILALQVLQVLPRECTLFSLARVASVDESLH